MDWEVTLLPKSLKFWKIVTLVINVDYCRESSVLHLVSFSRVFNCNKMSLVFLDRLVFISGLSVGWMTDFHIIICCNSWTGGEILSLTMDWIMQPALSIFFSGPGPTLCNSSCGAGRKCWGPGSGDCQAIVNKAPGGKLYYRPSKARWAPPTPPWAVFALTHMHTHMHIIKLKRTFLSLAKKIPLQRLTWSLLLSAIEVQGVIHENTASIYMN